MLTELRNNGVLCVDEPARNIIAEQRLVKGRGTSEQDPHLFVELMISGATHQFSLATEMQDQLGYVVFDRGLPDYIAYANLLKVSNITAHNASQHYRYYRKVFFIPGWEAIYSTDDERTINFEQSEAFGELIYSAYQDLGYDIVEVPRGTPSERAAWIMSVIEDAKSVSEH